MPLERLTSGGQTGADQAALKAARSHGLPTGGWCPLGWLTEDGPAPWLADFGLLEMPTSRYRPRTERNVRESDAVLWFGKTDTPGARVALWACKGMCRPVLAIEPNRGVRPSEVAAWVRMRNIKVLNVAGNRESKAPGIGEKVERFVGEVLRGLG